MKLLFKLLFFSLFIGYSFAQEHTIRGFVYDKKNGEAVIFEKVLLLKLDSTIESGANTDVNGFFFNSKNQQRFLLIEN